MGRRTDKTSVRARQLVGWDTETVRGRAVLITVARGDGVVISYPRTWDDAVMWLLHVAGATKGEDICAWAYNLDYDARAVLALAKKKDLRQFRYRKFAEIQGCKVCYIPQKFFSVAKGGKIFRSFDAYQYFAEPLSLAARRVGMEKMELRGRWYERVAHYVRTRDAKFLSYARQDARIVLRLAEYLTAEFERSGINFDRPISCASLAYRHFRHTFRAASPAENAEAERTYFGGRFEIFCRGSLGTAELWDINAAYPSVMAELSDISKMVYIRGQQLHDDAAYAAIGCRVRVSEQYAGIIPYRAHHNLIIFPHGMWTTYLDLSTFRRALSLGMIQDVYAVGQWIPTVLPERPFAVLADFYRRRKAGVAGGHALKIVANALYGKFCQSDVRWQSKDVVDATAELWAGRGWYRRETRAPFAIMAYAAEITARTRLRLWDFAQIVGWDNIYSYQTDGVICRPQTKIKHSDAFGAWGRKGVAQKLLIVGNGWYQYQTEDGKDIVHARGVPLGFSLRERLARARGKILTFGRRHVITMTEALREQGELNAMVWRTRKVNVNMDTKRLWPSEMTAREYLTRRQGSRMRFVFEM